MTGETYQANEDFTLRNHPVGHIQPRNGPVLAHGPYVWHPCHRHCLATIAFFLDI